VATARSFCSRLANRGKWIRLVAAGVGPVSASVGDSHIKVVEGRGRAWDSPPVPTDREDQKKTGSLTQRALLFPIEHPEPPPRGPRRLKGGWSMG
jgi:hypothetical protein